METKRENTAHTAATSAQDLVSKFQPMTNAQFESEKNYRIAVCVIRILKQNGLITAEEFQKMRTIIAKETGSYSYSLL
ncbi:MAG: SHOCT domain-containing protein [Monoglobaceae bacterium]